MYARVISLQVQPGKLDELLQIGRNSVAPVMQQQPGCTSITLLTDRALNKVLVVGLWESEADLLATEQRGLFQKQLAKLKHVLDQPPIREFYEVSLQVAPI